MIAVFARPGRDELTARTLALLDGHGGGSLLVGVPRLLWWVGQTPPPPAPPGWFVAWHAREPRGSVVDFWGLLAHAASRGGDLSVFEADVIPCRNLLPYVERVPAAWFTSYFNPRGRPVGCPQQLTEIAGFAMSQGLTIPARLVGRLAGADPRPAAAVYGPKYGHDLAMHHLLKGWREPVVWARSLVQHVKGPRADGAPRNVHLWDPKFVGEGFDALGLP